MKYQLCILVSSSVLFGCSSMNKSASLDAQTKLNIEASTKSQLISANSAEQYNELGRRYQQAGNHTMATVAYQKALQLSPNNSSSISGLASSYAQQNMLSVAIPLFEKAVSLSPTANAYNNLGYAYYLNQQYETANRVLKQALILEPDYAQAKNNLALVELNLHADKEVKQLANKQDNVDYVVVNSNTALVQEIQPAMVAENLQAQPEAISIASADLPAASLQQSSKNIYELNFDTKLNSAAVTAETTQTISEKPVDINQQKQLFAAVSGGITFKHVPVVSKLFDLATTGIVAMQLSDQHPYMEVINGNGLKGIARAVAGQLKDRGVEHIKVADAKRFNLTKTHIQYRTGYRNDAMTLNEHLINRPYLVRNDQMPRNVSVRLVLGRDLMKNMSKAEIASINNAITSNEDVTSI